MRWSKLFIPTLRENPADVEGIARQLLLRAGFVRLGSGGSSFLALGWRSLGKIAAIVRDEMQAIGGQEMLIAEPDMASIARGELRSYKQLPQVWYQLRAESMEACSFDLSGDESYVRVVEWVKAVLQRCGLDYVTVDGAGRSFVVLSASGEDEIVRCQGCQYAAKVQTAVSRATAPAIPDIEGDYAPEEFHTPGQKTIADLSVFTRLPESAQMKSLVMVADGGGVLVMVRGDHQLAEAKLRAVLGASELRPAKPEEIREWFGADAGSLGPVGVKNMRVLADEALRSRRNMISGSNRNDYHLRHVTPGEDFHPDYYDLRQAARGDLCVRCGGELEWIRCIEVGHATKRDKVDLHISNESGIEVTPAVGSYGIGMEQILRASVELSLDKDGMILPAAISPFDVVVTPVFYGDEKQRQAAEEIYHACVEMHVDVLLDDRDERPGVKFKDADLVGIPYRITIGKKLAQGLVEVVERRTHQASDVPVADCAAFIRDRSAA
ncbi:MAG TPA: YbaK/EbsC family protein [Bryobacteraceae bacterium]|nr:YbaK/EbsC family protein [Bryobacteraceae bacterium]